jgi:hypothetical protein
LDARRLTSVDGAELILRRIARRTPKCLDSGILPDPWAALGRDGPEPRLIPHGLWESRRCEGAFQDRVVLSERNGATSSTFLVFELREFVGRLVDCDPVAPLPDLLSVLEHGVHDPFEHPQSSTTQFAAPMEVQDSDAVFRHRFPGFGLEKNEIFLDVPARLDLLA